MAPGGSPMAANTAGRGARANPHPKSRERPENMGGFLEDGRGEHGSTYGRLLRLCERGREREGPEATREGNLTGEGKQIRCVTARRRAPELQRQSQHLRSAREPREGDPPGGLHTPKHPQRQPRCRDSLLPSREKREKEEKGLLNLLPFSPARPQPPNSVVTGSPSRPRPPPNPAEKGLEVPSPPGWTGGT